MSNIMTKHELDKIEVRVQFIAKHTATLNPNNLIDQAILEQYDRELDEIIPKLHKSYLRARMKEIGMRVIKWRF